MIVERASVHRKIVGQSTASLRQSLDIDLLNKAIEVKTKWT